MEELIKLMKAYSKKHDLPYFEIRMFDDGSGSTFYESQYGIDTKRFDFNDIKELRHKLSK